MTTALVNGLEATKCLHVGLFQDEKALQFLNLLQAMCDQCFQELHQVAHTKAHGNSGKAQSYLPSEMNPSSPYGSAFLAGLQTIKNWSDGVLQEEAERLRKQCPYIEDLYQYTIARYVQELYCREEPQTISLSPPPFKSFIHAFYIAIGNNPITRGLKYFTTFGLEKKSLMMDSIRSALHRVLESQIDYRTSLQLTTTQVGYRPPNPVSSNHVVAESPIKPLRPWNAATVASPYPAVPPFSQPPVLGLGSSSGDGTRYLPIATPQLGGGRFRPGVPSGIKHIEVPEEVDGEDQGNPIAGTPVALQPPLTRKPRIPVPAPVTPVPNPVLSGKKPVQSSRTAESKPKPKPVAKDNAPIPSLDDMVRELHAVRSRPSTAVKAPAKSPKGQSPKAKTPAKKPTAQPKPADTDPPKEEEWKTVTLESSNPVRKPASATPVPPLQSPATPMVPPKFNFGSKPTPVAPIEVTIPSSSSATKKKEDADDEPKLFDDVSDHGSL